MSEEIRVMYKKLRFQTKSKTSAEIRKRELKTKS
jgi:hypothetical protein